MSAVLEPLFVFAGNEVKAKCYERTFYQLSQLRGITQEQRGTKFTEIIDSQIMVLWGRIEGLEERLSEMSRYLICQDRKGSR